MISTTRRDLGLGKRLLLALSCSALLAGGGAAPALAEEDDRPETIIIDELGREVTLRTPIRAVYPDLWYQAEITRAIGALDTIVAIDQSSNPEKSEPNRAYFANLAGLPDVGHYNEPNWEAIVASGAEVYFGRRNSPWQEAVRKLEPFGVKVVVASVWDPTVLRAQLPNIGVIFGKEEGAARLAGLYDEIETLLTKRLKDVERKTVFFENNAAAVTVVAGSGWHDTILLGGGINIFKDVNIGDSSSASVHQYTVDPVEVITRDPDVIVHLGVDGQVQGYQGWSRELAEAQARRVAERPGWSGIKAVEDGEVYVVNNFFYSALGKQYGALILATWLYPEKFADVDVDALFAQWLELQGVEARPVSDYVHRIGQPAPAIQAGALR